MYIQVIYLHSNNFFTKNVKIIVYIFAHLLYLCYICITIRNNKTIREMNDYINNNHHVVALFTLLVTVYSITLILIRNAKAN